MNTFHHLTARLYLFLFFISPFLISLRGFLKDPIDISIYLEIYGAQYQVILSKKFFIAFIFFF